MDRRMFRGGLPLQQQIWSKFGATAATAEFEERPLEQQIWQEIPAIADLEQLRGNSWNRLFSGKPTLC